MQTRRMSNNSDDGGDGGGKQFAPSPPPPDLPHSANDRRSARARSGSYSGRDSSSGKMRRYVTLALALARARARAPTMM